MIRENNKNMELEQAVDKALDEMPEGFIIRQFLLDNRAEVKNMCLTEYDEEATMLMFKEEGREEGIEEGIAIGEKRGADNMALLVNKLLSENRMDDIKNAAASEAVRNRLFKEYGITTAE